MKKAISILLILVLAFSLFGCNNAASPDSTAGGEPNTATTAPPSGENTEPPVEIQYSQGASGTEILIGSTFVTSGAFSIIGLPVLAGMNAYLDMVNDKGGIDGRKITLVHIDDEGDPVKAKSTMQQLVEEEQVFATVCGSSVTAAVLDDLKAYGIPAVYLPTGIRQLYVENAATNEDGYNIFPVQPIFYMEGQIMAARAVGFLGAQKIGMLYYNDESSVDLFEGVSKVAGENGAQVQGAQLSATDSDVSGAVAIIKDFDPDVIICTAAAANLSMIIKELNSQGIAKPLITSYINAAKTVPELIYPDVQDKFPVYCSDWGSFGDEAAKAEFDEWISKYDASYTENSYAIAGWIASYMFCQGLYRIEGQDITWENYMRALEEGGPLVSPFGVEVDFSDGQRKGVSKMVFKIMDMESENGTNWSVIADFQTLEEMLEGIQ